jgi:hypothetical protein
VDDSEDFVEIILWGIGVLVALIALFGIKHWLAFTTARRIRESQTPFGMTRQDVDELKAKTGLTDEEAKAIRAAMSRRLVERTKAEQEAKQGPAKAEVALLAFEQQHVAQQANQLAPKVPSQPPLPPHMQRFVGQSEVELEQLRDAGFLTQEEFLIILRRRSE